MEDRKRLNSCRKEQLYNECVEVSVNGLEMKPMNHNDNG